ncbi:GNAT family N-acetyltransferase [Pelodictyon luteolum]|uniref:Acetyltransferase, GNAT family n=1 Tax=Chlorobium luteolum (strain DSM 273 / BCRC 81028 / 2530) TaxID=319225 RepID=Q3B4F6_CHLL3|nr:GNAT family N-acetyltransferase [Pelodictyon luteolum]ABB23775.1 acetyltransferase, GNAT family [Pelodictyon luteolum DSM 273]
MTIENILLCPLGEGDGAEVLDIFNPYTTSGFAAYTDTPLPEDAALSFIQPSAGYPACMARTLDGGYAVGFGMLRPYSPLPAFSRTAELTMFLRDGWTGRGIGTLVLLHLAGEAVPMGITTILASISSLNPASIRFHQKNGFRECGRLEGVGEKFGRPFDVVYCQKELPPIS